MTDDKIAEIRARHNHTEEMWWAAEDPCANQAHADRATLLAEVERLRKKMLEVAEELENEEPRSHKNIAFGIRNALEVKP